MMRELLKIENLSKHFEGIVAIDNLNLSIFEGTLTGIYGDNGSGKTTLFNLINGFEKPDSGILYLNGQEITNKSVINRANHGLGRLFQTPRLFQDVTVLENLLASSKNNESISFIEYLFKYRKIKSNLILDTKKAYEILENLNLKDKANSKAFKLSVGEKRLLSLGSLIMNDVKLLLLDEPFAGINEIAAQQIEKTIMSLKNNGLTLIMIEHNKEKLFEMADQIFELKNGKLIMINSDLCKK